jgi:hypothetical protein
VPRPNSKAAELFEEAVKLASEGDFPRACATLEESRKLYDGIGTAFNLAGCWQKIGKTASAHALFEDVAQKTRDAGDAEREKVARERAEALLPKLSRLRIELKERAPKTVVRQNGKIVPESDLGKAVPVDPGSYKLEVSASGKKPWSLLVEVNEPATTTVVAVPPLENESKTAAVPVAAATKNQTQPPPALPEESGLGTQRAIAIGFAAVGTAGLVVGGIEGAQYLSKNSDAKDVCPTSSNCTPSEIQEHAELVDAATSARTWMFIGLGTGVAALTTAGILYFSAGSSREDARSARAIRVAPLVSDDGTGFGAAVRGSF